MVSPSSHCACCMSSVWDAHGILWSSGIADEQVLANFALFNVICFGIFLKKIFFGQLRSIEYEVSVPPQLFCRN